MKDKTKKINIVGDLFYTSKRGINKNNLLYISFIFLICSIFEYIEFLVIKTDQTIFGDNFICKLMGIIVLLIALKYFGYSFEDIGFIKNKILKSLFIGTFIGILSFTLAYSVEFAILSLQGLSPRLEFYVGGFSLTENIVKNTGILFFLLCIILNIVNVIMEEGIFRGLFLNIANEKYSFFTSNLIVAFFFGVWHFVVPVRSYVDGQMSFEEMIGMGIGYIIIAGIMSIKWGMLKIMTGSLWIGLAEHFFNNTIGNLFHVTTSTGTDELQIVRILIAQLLTFTVILITYRKRRKLK